MKPEENQSQKAEKINILTYPNPILERASEPVVFPLSNQTQELIRDMFEVVKGIGVGLAAPQVGHNLQLLIVHLSEDEDFRKAYKEPDFVVMNPEITFYSGIKNSMIEGCLSFPDDYYRINRPANITIEYDTITNLKDFLNGSEPIIKRKNTRAKGWLSRVLQHEVDHLNGKLFINASGKKVENPGDEAIID